MNIVLKFALSGKDGISNNHITGLLCVSFVTIYQFVCVLLSLLVLSAECGIWLYNSYGTPEGTFPFRYLSEKKLKQEN